MERGADWERAAVRERWARLERSRRAARRLLAGAAAVLAGLSVLLFGLVTEACLSVGPWPHGCTAVVPPVTRLFLLSAGTVAILVGLRLGWTAMLD